jgi:hypothetical protein
MFLQWAEPTQEYGVFAIRGVIPYVLEYSSEAFSRLSNTENESSYLLNGNIQASKTFIKHFTAGLPSFSQAQVKLDNTCGAGRRSDDDQGFVGELFANGGVDLPACAR